MQYQSTQTPQEKTRKKKNIKSAFEPDDVIANRYVVQRLLGRGGMGEVYLVFDQQQKRQVALKTMLAKYDGNPKAVGRFAREVIAVRRFNHPGIVKMYQACRFGSLLFYTMEYLPGLTLRRYLRKLGALDIGSTYNILTLVCDALAHVHLVTVHRDLSPENIMLLPNRTIKIVDFGLSQCDKKVLVDNAGRVTVEEVKFEELENDYEDRLTRMGSSLGKAGYSAPEQILDASTVDQRTDIYSLGVIFVEMLTGKTPLTYASTAELGTGLPKEFKEFVIKAMARDPEERFATVAEFQEELERVYKYNIGLAEARNLPFLKRMFRIFARRFSGAIEASSKTRVPFSR